jgi:hypothetical protein
MVLADIFLGNSDGKHDFYNSYRFFVVKKYLEEIKASFNQILISSQILMCKKYKIKIDNLNNSDEKMDIFKEKFNQNIVTT